MSRIVVKDANVFIDLELMGLVHLWLQLPYETLTSSLVRAELQAGEYPLSCSLIQSGEIEEVLLDNAEIFLALEEYADTNLSDADHAVIIIAEKREGLILSGDGALRKVAKQREIEVHGTIWVLEQLIKNGKIASAQAADQLEYLLSLRGRNRRFLPRYLCQEYIKSWRK